MALKSDVVWEIVKDDGEPPADPVPDVEAFGRSFSPADVGNWYHIPELSPEPVVYAGKGAFRKDGEWYKITGVVDEPPRLD